MRPPYPLQPAIDWIQVLDQVEQTLRTTEAAAAEREQALSAASSASDAYETGTGEAQSSWLRLEERMKDWPLVLQKAEEEAGLADAVLLAGEEVLRRWLDHAERLEQRLATWANDEV